MADTNAPDKSSIESVSGNESALDLPVDRRIVDRLFRAGVIDDRARREALRILSGPVVWWPWIDRALLFLGLALALVGVVCFFAWNWDDLMGVAKLGLVLIGIIGCGGVTFWKGLDTTTGKSAQIGGALLVGVFILVCDDEFQTGLSDWQLFAGWGAILLPLAMIARFDVLWILWLAIVNFAVVLFWSPQPDDAWQFRGMTIGLLNGTALGLFEKAKEKRIEWLQTMWPRHVLILATLGPLITPVLVLIFEDRLLGELSWLLASAVFIGVLGVTHRFYRYRIPDLFALSCLVTSVCVVVTFLACRLLFEILDSEFALILLGGVIIGVVSAAAKWLMHVAEEIRDAGYEEAVI